MVCAPALSEMSAVVMLTIRNRPSVSTATCRLSEQLLNEIGRAHIHSAEGIAPDIVTMHSTVEFIDEVSGADRTIELVFPREADISAGRVSILTPVGAGLIGLRTGQSILWPDRDGRERTLTFVKVLQKNSAS